MDHLKDGNGNSIYSRRVQLFCNFNDVPLLEPAPERTLDDFYTLPEKFGWSIDETTCVTKQTHGSHSFNFVAQRWLYFEVLYQVFGHLRNFFRWEHFEFRDLANHNPAVERSRRLIRIQQVLDRARYFVSRCCTVVNPEGNTKWEVDELLALTLMVLGETLTRAQTKIHKAVGFNIPGWCSHDTRNHGWGYSRLMFRQLIREEWCMRAVYRLKALLRGNTIGLLYLYSILRESGLKGGEHKLCNANECRQEGFRDRNQYHHCSLGSQDHCSELADVYEAANQSLEGHPCKLIKFRGEVDGKNLATIINQGNIPLYQFDKRNKLLKIEEMSSSFDKSYAVFSHVWADGFGCFDEKNDMPLCVLNMFSNLLGKIAQLRGGGPDDPELFWIDTLCIPESKAYTTERLKAIRQMHNIYTHAKYTVVLDLSLMHVDIGSGYSEPAMKITMSNWMTRMWTLQEAVLSRNIYFNFHDRVCSMESLEELYDGEDRSLHDCLPAVSHLYWHGILGPERPTIRKQVWNNDGRQPKADFLALIWKALQWRSTTHPIHETLSLATMLNVDTELFANSPRHEPNSPGYSQECNERMIELLRQFSKLPSVPIPPGMIFLPGPRLPEKGFGWAPRTWLSSHEIESPDPLSLTYRESPRLTSEGLEVQFPGFLLHDLGDDRGTWSSREHFFFSADSTLQEWYRVEPKKDPHFPTGDKLTGHALAIILPRLPLGDSNEIALFVSIQGFRNGIRYVEILNRVWISRVGKQDTWSLKFRTGAKDARSAGETLHSDERWYVDGPYHQTNQNEGSNSYQRVNSIAEETPDSKENVHHGSIRKAFTNLTLGNGSHRQRHRPSPKNWIPFYGNKDKADKSSPNE